MFSDEQAKLVAGYCKEQSALGTTVFVDPTVGLSTCFGVTLVLIIAGTIAGLMKQTESGLAPLAGVYLHGRAGDIAYGEKGEALLASDIRENLAQALKELRQKQMAGH